MRNRILALLAVVALALPLMAGPAAAWEIKLQGVYWWQFDYLGQNGHQGFFGAYDVDAGAGTATFIVPVLPNQTAAGAFASLNGWMGERWPTGIVSGSDAQWNTQKMDLNIQIKINPAIDVNGTYRIGEWLDQGAAIGNVGSAIGAGTPDRFTFGLGNLVNSEYLESRSSGVLRAMSPGYWNTLYMVANLPVGRITFGKRASQFGMGLMWNGSVARSSEKLAISVPYGPFNFLAGFDVSRRSTDAGTPVAPGAPVGAPYYNNDYDRNNNRLWDIALTTTYRQGCMEFGVTYNLVNRHRGGEGLLINPANKLTAAYRDDIDLYGGAYTKYFNGRFFANAEVDFYQLATYNRRRTGGGVPQPGVRDTYTDHWRAAMEAGVVAGPSKVSVLYAWLQGDDRRGRQYSAAAGAPVPLFVDFIDKRGTLRADTAANTGVFRPYSYLMVYRYGLGMFVNKDSGYGYAEDASIWAARIDYSVAANLNVFGTFFYADRQSKSGWGWGTIKPDLLNINQTGQFRVWRQGIDAAPNTTTQLTNANSGSFRGGAPNIPDTQLGWEIDAGFSWRLLEGLTLDCTASYWKPGKWFKWACVDKRLPGWYSMGAPPLGAGPLAWGVNPDRAIDPIWGLEFAVRGEF